MNRGSKENGETKQRSFIWDLRIKSRKGLTRSPYTIVSYRYFSSSSSTSASTLNLTNAKALSRFSVQSNYTSQIYRGLPQILIQVTVYISPAISPAECYGLSRPLSKAADLFTCDTRDVCTAPIPISVRYLRDSSQQFPRGPAAGPPCYPGTSRAEEELMRTPEIHWLYHVVCGPTPDVWAINKSV